MKIEINIKEISVPGILKAIKSQKKYFILPFKRSYVISPNLMKIFDLYDNSEIYVDNTTKQNILKLNSNYIYLAYKKIENSNLYKKNSLYYKYKSIDDNQIYEIFDISMGIKYSSRLEYLNLTLNNYRFDLYKPETIKFYNSSNYEIINRLIDITKSSNTSILLRNYIHEFNFDYDVLFSKHNKLIKCIVSDYYHDDSIKSNILKCKLPNSRLNKNITVYTETYRKDIKIGKPIFICAIVKSGIIHNPFFVDLA